MHEALVLTFCVRKMGKLRIDCGNVLGDLFLVCECHFRRSDVQTLLNLTLKYILVYREKLPR